MNKKIFKRGIALAMLLVLTVSAFIVPTSAKEVTKTEEVQKNGDGYYISINDMKTVYGDNSYLSYTYYFDSDVNDNFGGSLSVNALVNTQDRWLGNIDVSYLNESKVYTYSEFGQFINEHSSQSDGTFSIFDVPLKLTGEFAVKDFHLHVTYTVEVESESLIKTMFSGFGETINGLTDGIKSMFVNILYVDGTSASGLSAFAKFGFLMGGLTMALGLGYIIINKLR